LSVSELALEINKNLKPSLIHDATEGGIYGAFTEMVAYKEHGILLEKEPSISPILERLATWLDFDPFRIISSGVLVVCIEEAKIKELEEILSAKGVSFEIVGSVTKEEGIVKLDGEIVEKPKGDQIIKALAELERMKIA